MSNDEGPWPDITGACRDGFIPATPTIASQNPLATVENQCNYGCNVDGYNYTQCGWETFNTFNPDACNDSVVGVLNNPGNTNYNITQPQYDGSGVLTGASLTTNITDASNAAGVVGGYSWCFKPTAGCFDLRAGDNTDVFGKCADGSTGPCGAGLGYLATNTAAPDWCLDPTNLVFTFGNAGIPNTALAAYKTSTGTCPGHEQASCIISGCTDSNGTNYDPTATIDDGSCVIPALLCPATQLYWPVETLDVNGEFLTTDYTGLYFPNTGTPLADFYTSSGTLGTVATDINVSDQPFEHYMDDICITDGGLDPILYSQVKAEGTTCASCLYQGWEAATTSITYCNEWNDAALGWNFSDLYSNCTSYGDYSTYIDAYGNSINNRDNELSIPWEKANHVGMMTYMVSELESTKVGYDTHPHTSARQEAFGAVSSVLKDLEYVNMDWHSLTENFPAREMIKLKEISLSGNLIGQWHYKPAFSGVYPKIEDLKYATDLEKIDFSNAHWWPSSVADWYATSNKWIGATEQPQWRTTMDGNQATGGQEGRSTKRGGNADGIMAADNYNIRPITYTAGNSVIHGSDGNDYLYPNNDGNIINSILNTAGDNSGTTFINLKYLNINKQSHAQAWVNFRINQSNKHMLEFDGNQTTKIDLRHIRLDLSKQTNLEELHMQSSPVASIYFNDGFEYGYYPSNFTDANGIEKSPSVETTTLAYNDFALMPNLKLVDTRNSQLFAHVNFAYNDKLEKLYVGRGFYKYGVGRTNTSTHSFLPYLNMIDGAWTDMIEGMVVDGEGFFPDRSSILRSSANSIMPPTFDFKANPSELKEVWVLGEKVGGSALITSLDRKNSGLLTTGCHNCDLAVDNILGFNTGNNNSKGIKMDIGSPLELVSMEELNDINLRIWTNGAICVDDLNTNIDSTAAGKSHVYFGRADVVIKASTHGQFTLNTLFYDRSVSNRGTDINIQSEIEGLGNITLGSTGIVPGARLSGISYDGGTTFVSTEDVKCYVVSVNNTSIKLSRDIGSIATTFKSVAFANLSSGAVTQGNQGSNIVYAVNNFDPNQITITGSDLQLKFTMSDTKHIARWW